MITLFHNSRIHTYDGPASDPSDPRRRLVVEVPEFSPEDNHAELVSYFAYISPTGKSLKPKTRSDVRVIKALTRQLGQALDALQATYLGS